MLEEKDIKNLLKRSLSNYIKCLERNDFDYLEYKGQIIAYINILNREDLKVKYLDLIKAKELISII